MNRISNILDSNIDFNLLVDIYKQFFRERTNKMKLSDIINNSIFYIEISNMDFN